jgi:hypothetical protein
LNLLLAAAAGTLWFSSIAPAQNSDPTSAPVPATGLQVETRALVLRFRYDPQTPAQYLGAFLADTPSRQTVSAAPQIVVTSESASGEVLDAFNADYNHWVHDWDTNGSESMVEQFGQVGRIIMPFDPLLERVTLRDRGLDTDFLVIDITRILADICANGSLDDPGRCANVVTETILSSGFEPGESQP